jgi:hypothetical protein
MVLPSTGSGAYRRSATWEAHGGRLPEPRSADPARNSGTGTRWHQAARVSAGRAPHSSPHTPPQRRHKPAHISRRPDRDSSGISRVRPHDRNAVRRCADGHDTSVGEGQAPARRRRDGRSLDSGTWRAGWGSRRTGHPAAGQAEPQRHPAASALKALQTLGRVWPDRAGAAEVMARPGAARRWVRPGIDLPVRLFVRPSSSGPSASRAGNGQAEFSSSGGLMSDTDAELRWTGYLGFHHRIYGHSGSWWETGGTCCS